jgi:uncharacterized membrane protein
MAIGSNKTTGLVGASLMILGVITTITTIAEYVSGATSNLAITSITGVVALLTFVGFILFMVAMNGFSKDYAEPKIFSHVLNGFLFGVVAVVVAAILWIGGVVMWNAMQKASLTESASVFTGPAVGGFLITFAIIMLIYFLFYYKAFNLLAQKSGIQQFTLTGKLLILAGIVNIISACIITIVGLTNATGISIFTISLTPGAFIQYIAWGYAAKGYSAIQIPTTPTAPIQSYVTPTAPVNARYCSNCGNQTQTNDIYCAKCGKKLQ